MPPKKLPPPRPATPPATERNSPEPAPAEAAVNDPAKFMSELVTRYKQQHTDNPQALTLPDLFTLVFSLCDTLTAVNNKIGDTDKMQEEITDLQCRVEVVESTVSVLAAAGDQFPPNLSLVISNLPDEGNEALPDQVKSLIADGLQLEDVETLEVERLSARTYADAASEEAAEGEGNARVGVVKVKLASLDQKKKCLRAKRKLRDNSSYKEVYLQGVECHATRQNRQNLHTLMRGLGVESDFKFASSGKLLKKHNRPVSINTSSTNDGPNTRSTRSSDRGRSASRGGSQRGRGGGGRGRGRGGGGG